MSEKTASALGHSSSTDVTVSSFEKSDPLRRLDTFSAITTTDTATKPGVRSLDNVLSPSADLSNGSLTYEKHEWRETLVS